MTATSCKQVWRRWLFRHLDAVYASQQQRLNIEQVAALLRIPFRGLWLDAGRDTLVARVAARRGDASDGLADTVAQQLQDGPGILSSAWARIDAGGTADQTLQHVLSTIGMCATNPPQC